MPFYDPDVVAEAKKLDLLTYLQNYEYPAMFTAPKPMTAYGFPTGNGAGFRRESAASRRWIISSK